MFEVSAASLRTFRRLIGFGGSLSAAILVAAAATPLLYPVALSLGVVDEEGDFLRVFRRLLMIGGLAVLFIHFRPWRDGGASSYGLRATRRNIRSGILAAGAASAAIIGVIAIYVWFGILNFRDGVQWFDFAARGLKYLVPALVIATIEELLFRGWMFRRLSPGLGIAVAASATSAVYAAVHAFKPKNLSVSVTQDWVGCLSAFAQWIGFATSIDEFGPTFLGLFLFGVVLTFLTLRSGSVVPAIGVHAVSVLIIHAYGKFMWRAPDLEWAGGKALYDGAPIWLLLAIALIALHPRPSSVPQAAVEMRRGN